MAISAVKAQHSDVVVAIEAWDFDGVEFLWELPHRVVSLLARMRGGTRPLPFIEDVAVPPEALQEFFVRIQQTLHKHDVTASLYSHAASRADSHATVHEHASTKGRAAARCTDSRLQ